MLTFSLNFVSYGVLCMIRHATGQNRAHRSRRERGETADTQQYRGRGETAGTQQLGMIALHDDDGFFRDREDVMYRSKHVVCTSYIFTNLPNLTVSRGWVWRCAQTQEERRNEKGQKVGKRESSDGMVSVMSGVGKKARPGKGGGGRIL